METPSIRTWVLPGYPLNINNNKKLILMPLNTKTWREMPVISRQISLRHDRTSFDKNIQKNKNGAGQHTAFFTWTWRASFAKLTNDHDDVFSFRFFLGRSVRATSWRKTPKLVLTGCFSVSAQTSLKRYSERLLLFELSSSLSRIDDVFVNFGEKK